MSAHIIGHITIKDAGKWQQYVESVPATVEPWGGELVFRGKLTTIFSGEHPFTDTVVIRFPDTTAIDSWYASEQYQALIPLREAAADITLLSFQ